ncbi:MAG: AMP-binding protein, partial [Chloroflexi bacterium]|nr:AMP-binding protein [Chloroflexota bacterium]
MAAKTVGTVNMPQWQQAIRDRCRHPSGNFVGFDRDALNRSIPDRFEKMVRMYPDRVAVKTDSHEFTYDSLNGLANRIAHAVMEKRGEGAEPVALMLDHDAPVIGAIMGLLKTGKFFVPMNPSLPRRRLEYMLEDSQAVLMLTDAKNLPLARELVQEGFELINVDELDESLSPDNVGLPIPPDAYAYLLYTSGTTGEPKAVVQDHVNAIHDIIVRTSPFHICSEDRLTLLTFGTGSAMKNIFTSLLNGAALYPMNVAEKGLAHFADWLIKERVTIYISGSPLFRHFVDTLTGEEGFPDIRLIRLGSDTLTKRDVELYRKHFASDCVLVNGLASTEAGTQGLYFMDKETEIHGNTVPVGYAVEGKEILLLDDEGNEVGSGQMGEITVRSRYLSPGYWRRPDLTQAAFTEDPDAAGERTYRTGDMGTKLPDGCLLHQGRKDFQVKIRGYTVALSEVEKALLDLEYVKRCVVTTREDGPNDKRLVAYIVPDGESPPRVSAIRRALGDRLPGYMVPSSFVVLDALPLALNGKVDRNALPNPGNGRPEIDTPFVQPRTPVEVELANIWADVLRLDRVGIRDGFFDLGGHSLMASQVVSRAITAFRVELPLKSLFESPTVEQMALVITGN